MMMILESLSVHYGCTQEYLNFSLFGLRQITKRFSVEYAIRDFINEFPKQTLAMLYKCCISQNYHERRLASESLRIKLPWAKKITIQHYEVLEVLETLKEIKKEEIHCLQKVINLKKYDNS